MSNSFGTKELYLNSIENTQTKLSLQYLQSAASKKNKDEMFELGRYYYVNSSTITKNLEKLIGLQNVKEEISYLENIILTNKKKKSLGLLTIEVSKHIVFTGNPGTGKTTVARSVAQIFKENGLLKKINMSSL